MRNDDHLETTARALAALGEPRRLSILGLLGRRPHFSEELADILGIHPATVSHHIQKLRVAGLVTEERLPPYVLIHLQPEAVVDVLDRVRAFGDLAEKFGLPDEEELSARILARHFNPEGKLEQLPSSRREMRTVLRHIVHHLDTGRIYPEREVRRVLLEFVDDPDRLIDELLKLGWLRKDHGVMHRVEEVDP